MTPALEVRDLEAGYEPGLPILRRASLAVMPGEIVALLGPNGAGKSTLVKACAGLVPVSAGQVLLDGRDITRVSPHRMVHEGLGFVPQTENIFANLTVAENLELAAAIVRADRRAKLGQMYALFPDLARQRRLSAGRLSGGQRQMLAVARALVATPRLLVLDEPSAGLSPLLVGVVFEQLRRVRESGVTILLVEQNVKAALALADRAVVLVEGRERLEGPAAALATDPRLGGLYLGAAAEAH
ncbi:MAG TPA: ABC transporter ATP-binding protein [Acetobacteraceae bacterium]|jgi:branched-chain amino acid transport system ATP-binding protein|nr:ABC transporter ATP-binding protein [Acetobacteraceae bacterium]